ncbi:MAG: helix-turn-helix domain-containing protein [Waterburya sp.]
MDPFEGESLSHFLGRFRRANEMTPTGLGKEAGIGGVIARWEKFYHNPFPSLEQLEALAKVAQIDAQRLRQMLPPRGIGMKHQPIRLCAACHVESPCHRIEWQFKQTDRCKKHSLRLLSGCPNCKARFRIPALWSDSWCSRCFLPFAEMVKYQKRC